MFNALASLAQRRGKLVVAIGVVFFALAGALGGSVADRLDPYGADDPDTEAVIADERLEAAGFRDASVIVLIERHRPDHAGRREAGQRDRAPGQGRPEDVAEVTGYLQTRSPDFVSEDGDSTYLAVSLMPTDDKELQEAGSADQRRPRRRAGRHGRRLRARHRAGEQAGRGGPAHGRDARLPACSSCSRFLFFRSVVAAMLPLMVGGLAIVGTFLLLRIAQRARLDLDLRPQPDHRARARPGDRLQPVRGLALPRGDREDAGPGSRR